MKFVAESKRGISKSLFTEGLGLANLPRFSHVSQAPLSAKVDLRRPSSLIHLSISFSRMNVFLPGLPFLPFRPTSPIPPRYPSEGNKDKNKSKCKPSKIQRRKNKKKRSQLQSEARMKGAKLHDEINNPQSSSPKKKKSSRQKKREKKEKEREKQLFESCQLVMKERGAQECGICLDFVDGKLNPYYGLLGE